MDEFPNSVEASKKRKDKGKSKTTNKKTMSSTMDEIAETLLIIGHCMMDPPSIKISLFLYTIPEAIAELKKYLKVMEESNFDLYDYCTMFLREKHNQ
ncbi:hypothetical protein KSP40_PGU004113 [Platanthera guangdongensis]|uniref:Uncharacterized protein n=1 Tax=Platanthera guangdongensis TaxID=2320717 RepID=A0ABR2MRM5_9ASPA